MTPSELQHLRSVLAEAPEEIDIVHDVQCVYASTASEAFYEAARSAVPALIEEVEMVRSRLDNWDWHGLLRDTKRGDFDSIVHALRDIVAIADALAGPDPDMEKP